MMSIIICHLWFMIWEVLSANNISRANYLFPLVLTENCLYPISVSFPSLESNREEQCEANAEAARRELIVISGK